ncbi:hypothetical protein D9C73_014529 [Collichthys lucidus]|uniref:Uncharacterized protein n=1 Tax=Collichthys lucidus TaxID=240159 RepID=A0A4V6AQ64_COLLU|nr:hypothetical protein D9C73_014529 [Collichthys lucidus]
MSQSQKLSNNNVKLKLRWKKDVSEPSYYVLGAGDSQVCLASDFSKHDVNKNKELFDGTEPVLMDQLYSQVAFLQKGNESQCEDPVVNLMSMTVLGLRLLFLKTLVFNALMTFRLWVSQCEYETIATNPSLSFYKGFEAETAAAFVCDVFVQLVSVEPPHPVETVRGEMFQQQPIRSQLQTPPQIMISQ